MEALARQHCQLETCPTHLLSARELGHLHTQVADWTLEEAEGVLQLEKSFLFADFVSALAFADNLGALAEQEQHHPSLHIEWGRVTVNWYTHKVRGLHTNDFIMAAKTSALYEQLQQSASWGL